MGGVLKGVRVLDLGRYIAGPYCATLLAEFGAEVIRVEKCDGSGANGSVELARSPNTEYKRNQELPFGLFRTGGAGLSGRRPGQGRHAALTTQSQVEQNIV
jgi:hypothetical protein